MKWSYSSLKLFEQCPRKYYHLRVAKDFKEDDNKDQDIGAIHYHS